MKHKDRDSLTSLLNQTKDVYQNVSRHIHWTAADTECLDDLMHMNDRYKDFTSRVLSVNQSRETLEIIPLLLIYKAWQRTKAVYSFNSELLDDMGQTEDTSLYVSLLERLPFKDMLFFYPDGVTYGVNGEKTVGMYVHLEKHPEQLWLVINYLKQEKENKVFPGVIFAFPITDGMKISQIFETTQYQKCMLNFKGRMIFDRKMSEQEAEEYISAERTALNIAVNLMYYLSSKNADIKAIKKTKRAHKASQNSKMGDNLDSIKHHEVGSQYAEIVYRRFSTDVCVNEDEDNESIEDVSALTVDSVHKQKTPKKRRPHARRAHWQHYWTGKGRTTREVRWISDLFVGTNRDDQAVIVYDTAKQTLKGKQNPNTSKKKRNKKE